MGRRGPPPPPTRSPSASFVAPTRAPGRAARRGARTSSWAARPCPWRAHGGRAHTARTGRGADGATGAPAAPRFEAPSPQGRGHRPVPGRDDGEEGGELLARERPDLLAVLVAHLLAVRERCAGRRVVAHPPLSHRRREAGAHRIECARSSRKVPVLCLRVASKPTTPKLRSRSSAHPMSRSTGTSGIR